jgi:(p)ppGpp synthase/HD superfamily hydrolase
VLSRRFDDALAYATELHRKQIRKGSGVPYVSHLMAVCALALEYGGDENEAIAALLHDAIEDQGGRATGLEILRRFGPEVAAIVDGCTDSEDHPKPPWRPRREAYVARLRTASDSVRLVSACDKIHNVRSIVKDYREVGESVWSIFNGGREGTLWYYNAVLEALLNGNPGHQDVVAELGRTVAELNELAAFA